MAPMNARHHAPMNAIAYAEQVGLRVRRLDGSLNVTGSRRKDHNRSAPFHAPPELDGTMSEWVSDDWAQREAYFLSLMLYLALAICGT